MYCYKCGAEVQPGAERCTACGAPICTEYGCKPCRNDIEIDITQKKVDVASIAIGAVVALISVIFVLSSVIGFVRRIYTPRPRDIVTTNDIQAEDIWYTDSKIKFTSYPAQVSPGQWAELSIEGVPETEYSITVQCGSRALSTDRLWPVISDEAGIVSWTWHVPEGSAAGRYSITVFSDDGEKNSIDYAVLDRSGKVLGERPLHQQLNAFNMDGQSYPDSDSNDAEPDLLAATSAQNRAEETVYVTETGEKYHREGCQYLSESCIEMSVNDAEAGGYTPCVVCNP